MHLLIDLWHALREAFFMLWETLWALVLGFGLSGAVRAFVPRAEMERLLGGHDARRVARAALLGAVSSSCSYAAASMARTLVARGADFVTSLVFMVASTNLVLELGAALWVLMGWQFAAAEVVGGLIMIGLLALAAPRVLGRAELADVRARLRDDDAGGAEAARSPRRARTLAGWGDAARHGLADVRMLRRELVAGYLVAGLLAVLVPTSAWRDVFISGHGAWTTIENVTIGPAVAIASFVCSVGNVPLAAALWHGGIAFGGVVSFVFADLITFPLLLVYRRSYGTRLTLRLLGVMWAVMSLAGLAVEELFRLATVLPEHRAALPAPTGFHSTATLVLDLTALAACAAALVLARGRTGAAPGSAIDPVCGMPVELATAAARASYLGATVGFCSDHCRERFVGDPARYMEETGARHTEGGAGGGHGAHRAG